MTLDLPTVSTTPGPEWANKVNAALLAIAEHTHATGDGVKVTPTGLNINQDLSAGGNNLTTIRTVRLSSQGGVVSGPTDLGCVVNVNGDLYWINNAGTPVQLTTGGAINIASVGTIGGDYGQPGVTASVAYSDTTKTFTFLQDTGEAAELFVGDLNIANAATGALSVSIGADAATASYALILPIAAPAVDTVLTFDAAGQGTFRTISGTSGEVTVTPSAGAHTVSLPATVTKSITFSGNNIHSGTNSFTGATSGRGILPLGSVIATFPHLTGAYACTATTAADADGFVQCAGQTLSDATSPMNGTIIPNINNNIFLMGNATSGTAGGSNTKTLTTTELPAHTHTINHGHANTFGLTGTTSFASTSHTHDMSHTHQAWRHWQSAANSPEMLVNNIRSVSRTEWDESTSPSTGLVNYLTNSPNPTAGSGRGLEWNSPASTTEFTVYTSGALNDAGSLLSNTGSPSATASVGFSGAVTDHSGSSGSAGSGSAFDVRPSYITTRYVMRVK
jgi:hypothetical protein